MDRVRQLIDQKVSELDLDLSGLSQKMGRNHAYLQQFMKRGVPTELKEGDREKLAPLIGLKPDDLRLSFPEHWDAVKERVGKQDVQPVSRKPLTESPVPSGYVRVREYAADGAAGGGREPVLDWQGQAEVLAEWIIPKDFLPPEHRNATVAVVRVQGDSMAPSLMPHDRVMVDISHNWLGPDGAYLAWNGLGIVFKRLQALPGNPPQVRFFSDNPAYEPYTLSVDEVKIFGRVIGKWSWW